MGMDAMTLGQRQRVFSLALARLIIKAYELGYEISMGDAYRDPRAFGVAGEAGPYGNDNSNHKRRLACDLNLFIDGEYITNDKGHRELGTWWEEEYGEVGARWGGHYGDPNHYECLHV